MLAFCGASITFAKPAPQKLILNGGIVAEGHIVRQQTKTITFSVERAFATVESKWVGYRTDRAYSLNTQDRWRQWIDEQTADAKGLKDCDSITLTTIELTDKSVLKKDKALWTADSAKFSQLRALFDGGVSPQVYVCEDGAIIRFIQVSQCERTFNIADISSIEYSKRDPMALTGIIDVIETKSGPVYQGQIVSRKPGRMVTIKTDTKPLSILNSDIACQRKMALSKDLPLTSQAEFIDEVSTTNGIIRGIIVTQDNRNSTPYIVIAGANGEQTRVNMKDIKAIDTYKNQQYEELTDITIQADEVLFNRTNATSVPYTEMKEFMVLPAKHMNKVAQVDADGESTKLIVEMKATDDYRGAMLFPIKKHKVGKENLYAFTLNDVLTSSLVNKNEMTTPHGTLRRTYSVTAGMYVVYVPKTRKAFFCNVK
jgi:hypothetical protein